MKTDTIAAIATGMSNSGIGIVRISGEQAFSVIDSIFRNRKGERVRLSLSQSHTVHYGYIYDGDEKVDEALVIIMKGPTAIRLRIRWRLTATGECLWSGGFWRLFFTQGPEQLNRESLQRGLS